MSGFLCDACGSYLATENQQHRCMGAKRLPSETPPPLNSGQAAQRQAAFALRIGIKLALITGEFHRMRATRG